MASDFPSSFDYDSRLQSFVVRAWLPSVDTLRNHQFRNLRDLKGHKNHRKAVKRNLRELKYFF